MASVYALQERWDESERLTSQTLVQRRVLGAEHPDTISSMGNLAAIYEKQGSYAEAEPIAASVLAVKRRTLGSDHPSTLTSVNNLAVLYRRLARSQGGGGVYLEVIEVRRRVLGEHHFERRSRSPILEIASRPTKVWRCRATIPGCVRGDTLVRWALSNESTRAVGAKLISLYEAWGKPRQLAEWRRKSRSENRPGKHPRSPHRTTSSLMVVSLRFTAKDTRVQFSENLWTIAVSLPRSLCSADIPRARSHCQSRYDGAATLRTGDLSRSVSRYDDRQE